VSPSDRSRAVQSTLATPADRTTGTVLSHEAQLLEEVLVWTDSSTAIDQAFADFQPILFNHVLANGLADTLAL
jgi:hypothetical protein